MFSVFLDVWYAVKPKVNRKYLVLTRKSVGKIRKTVYGKFFRKPFSKTRVRLPRVLDHFTPLILSLCSLSLSLSHCLLSFSLSRATPSHTPLHCSLSLSLLAFSLAQIVPSQPELARAAIAESHQSHCRSVAPIPPASRRTDLLLQW